MSHSLWKKIWFFLHLKLTLLVEISFLFFVCLFSDKNRITFFCSFVPSVCFTSSSLSKPDFLKSRRSLSLSPPSPSLSLLQCFNGTNNCVRNKLAKHIFLYFWIHIVLIQLVILYEKNKLVRKVRKVLLFFFSRTFLVLLSELPW